MTVTESDIERDRQGSGNEPEDTVPEGFHNARARDGQRTSSGTTLPDTERLRELGGDWWDAVRNIAVGLMDGSFWEEQPPSPAELIERYRESSWTHSEYGVLGVLRWCGCALSIAWSLPLYALAILGQRFGRGLTAALFFYLLIHLI